MTDFSTQKNELFSKNSNLASTCIDRKNTHYPVNVNVTTKKNEWKNLLHINCVRMTYFFSPPFQLFNIKNIYSLQIRISRSTF